MTARNQTLSSEIGIVGGSVAGLFTAHVLSQAGKQVRVFEGAEQFDPKPRTLIVTHRLHELLGRVGKSSLVNEIRRFELFTDGRVARISLRHPDLVVERSKLIRDIAHAARGSGADISFDRRFVSMEQKSGTFNLQLHTNRSETVEEAQVNTLVAADGAISRVAKAAGWPAQQTVPLLQAIVGLPKDMPSDTTRVWFIPDDTPYFYWLIPDSPTRGVLGLIGEDGPKSRLALERFLEKHHLEPLEYQAARIPIYSKWVPVSRRLPAGDVYLVGDAAGHVKVTTVGGIVTGLRGALGVSEAILMGKHGRKLHSLRRELDIHLMIRKVIHNFNQTRYSRLVDLLNARTRRDLEEHTRDEPGGVLWRLCLHQPRLMLFGLRAALTGGGFPGASHSLNHRP